MAPGYDICTSVGATVEFDTERRGICALTWSMEARFHATATSFSTSSSHFNRGAANTLVAIEGADEEAGRHLRHPRPHHHRGWRWTDDAPRRRQLRTGFLYSCPSFFQGFRQVRKTSRIFFMFYPMRYRASYQVVGILEAFRNALNRIRCYKAMDNFNRSTGEIFPPFAFGPPKIKIYNR